MNVLGDLVVKFVSDDMKVLVSKDKEANNNSIYNFVKKMIDNAEDFSSLWIQEYLIDKTGSPPPSPFIVKP